MQYLLENLGDERFQALCQALITKSYPHTQCFPLSQPDGGRDAIAYLHGTGSDRSFAVFQVKFNRNPQTVKDPHKWLLDILQVEAPKIAKLVPKGAKEFFLVTNVPGTAHLDAGAIDKVQEILTSTLPVPAQCWWRDDISRRIDDAWDIKWSYPEIMSTTDVLRAMYETGLGGLRDRRETALRAYLQTQFDRDAEIRFKQVELQNALLDLFVDVPLSWPPQDATSIVIPEALWRNDAVIERMVSAPHLGYREDLFGAAEVLLNPAFDTVLPQLVIEGAPGQGKSTLVQYVCQVHRMKLLNKDDSLTRVPEALRPVSARLPIKIDLRDLATWLGGKNPFRSDEGSGLDSSSVRSLESFLATQIHYESGGVDFDVSDLHAISKVTSLLLVLDGLDEVADIPRRDEVVQVVIEGISRLSSAAASLRVVITSRPAAFANSPGFPDKEFPRYSLGALRRDQMLEYGKRWIEAKHLTDRDAKDILGILKDKIEQPHLRDLARNPMQLTILLSLVHSLGASLPDKRTQLYDSYVERFISREVEKNTTIKEHRDLLISIHQYIA